MLKKIIISIILIIMLLPLIIFASGQFRQGGENGELWRVGKQVYIYWDSVDIISDKVSIYAWDKENTKLKVISLDVINNGRYLWLIPDSLADGSYKLKIVSSSMSKNFLMSENYFTIYNRSNSNINNSLSNRNSSIILFPNPTRFTTRLNLHQEGDISISAVDVLGRSFPMWSGFATAGDMELDVSTLSTGSYTLLINYGTKVEAVKLIKN